MNTQRRALIFVDRLQSEQLGRRRFSGLRAIILMMLAVIAPAVSGAAPTFPAKPIRLIVSNTVGSAPDIISRLIAVKLTENWGQPIVVDNRAGAAGLLAAEYVVKAAPDGYTLWVATLTQLLSMSMNQRFNMSKDFIPVSYMASTPFVIAASASLPVTTTAEFIAYAKARPGKLLYGSSGQWGSSHLCMEQFRRARASVSSSRREIAHAWRNHP
jgi:tripartite-type tricarboxylate transporter receptor subunit TctC